MPSLTARSRTPHSARNETQRRRRSCAKPCSLATRANVFRGVQLVAASYTFTWLSFVDGEGAREVREMDLRRLLASALLSSPSRTASLADCRATSILCVAKRTSMMLRLTVVTGSPSCPPISWEIDWLYGSLPTPGTSDATLPMWNRKVHTRWIRVRDSIEKQCRLV